jgi:hypothetical protein
MVIQKIHSRNTKLKGIMRVERNYEGRNKLRGSKQITSHKLRLLYYIYLNIIYVHITN